MSNHTKDIFERNLEIVKYALKNPFASRKDIAKEFGVTYEIVKNVLIEIPRLKMDIKEKKEEIIRSAYDDILDDVTDITAKTISKYKDMVDSNTTLETRELRDLAAIAKETLERKNLME
jgi:predicted transcriptional regulator